MYGTAAAAGALRRIWAGVRLGIRRVLRAWRRSLLFRVVAGTLVLSVLVLVLVGQLVLTGVRDGLVDAKVATSLARAEVGFESARTQLTSEQASSADVGQLLTQVVTDLRNQAGRTDLYEIVLMPPPATDTSTPAGRGLRTTNINVNTIPDELVQALSERPEQTISRFVALCYGEPGEPCPEPGRDAGPGLAVGKQLRLGTGSYQLYFVFPLTEEAETISLVRGRLILGGAAMTLLLAAIAYLVARSVVRPVQSAAKVAERLAAGRLAERMTEKGEDELARLASSFNEMASALARQIRQLEDLSRLQRRFVSDVSHELRTPLTTIRMAADVLHSAREDFAPPVARSAELMHTQVERFEAMLTELLEISRFDAGAAVLEPDPVDLRDVVRRVVEAVEPIATEQYSTRFRLDLPDTECIAEVDTRRIERIVRNLLFNALEHGEGRDVLVRVAADETAVALAVRDYGVGLRPGEASLAFNRFWRADPSRARRSGGTGLGLSISREDARLHGGWLQAWGEPRAGAQFRLTVPRIAGTVLTTSPLPLEPPDRHVVPPLSPAPGAETGEDLQRAGRGPDV
ncbi:MtrAB system histidine kinase MtrB [Sporichthya polymorpha]|uniref:MtrAB system histidine kinase MtrB n=1 Tax=Sporichthya polymorpha TaxID=35751 RepID=UPI000360ABF3|nr:MtrAB system histidine kinase MtrB [Sporichthya polymorpha]